MEPSDTSSGRRCCGPWDAVGFTTVDHPTSRGSNPGNHDDQHRKHGIFDPVNGPWDVDNDGDGITDSVWIDVGLPVQTAPDGRQFKVLAAPLVIDLDGRLQRQRPRQRRAGGHELYDAGESESLPMPPTGGPRSDNRRLCLQPGGDDRQALVLRGAGCGPADISLARSVHARRPNHQHFYSGTRTDRKATKAAMATSTSRRRFRVACRTRTGNTATMTSWRSLSGSTCPAHLITSPSTDDTAARACRTMARLPTCGAARPWSSTIWGSPMYSFFNGTTQPWSGSPSYALSANSTTGPKSQAIPTRSTFAQGDSRRRHAADHGRQYVYACGVGADSPPIRYRLQLRCPTGCGICSTRSGSYPNLSNPQLPQEVTTDSYDLPTPGVLPTRDMAAVAGRTCTATAPCRPASRSSICSRRS